MTATTRTYDQLHAVLVEVGIDSHDIRPDAALREDLDVDSAELVEIVAKLVPGDVDGKAFKDITTVADLVAVVEGLTWPRRHLSKHLGGSPMEHTEHTITVDAPASAVWDVLADVERYPELFAATQSATIIEEDDDYQIVQLEVDVSGQVQSWTTRRDLDARWGVIAYQQLQTAPLVEHMSGEWRAVPFGTERTQLVLTHDFAARREDETGTVAGQYSHAEAFQLLCDAVERNSVAHLAAVRDESERRATAAGAS
jgi:ribosome-associated toxin RatA of RatAB toxin-antitoxin module/acyl carrier protein